MKKISINSIILAICLLIFLEGEGRAVDITKITRGTVEGMARNYINISDSNNKLEQMSIDSYTVYDNVQQLSELKLGDKVEIAYVPNHGKPLAQTVTKLEEESGN